MSWSLVGEALNQRFPRFGEAGGLEVGVEGLGRPTVDRHPPVLPPFSYKTR
jgi:hypothetical protein